MSIADTARLFFEACETGQGWEGCKAYCHANATFAAQAEPLADVTTVADYAEWMKALLTPLPDGRYDLKALATDDDRKIVCAYAVFKGTHTGDGGPVAATGKSATSDYVYAMAFDGDKISTLTKIWHSGLALQQLGWD
ncbi:MAG: ester cyclase [Pseudomonadota bacterium]